MRTEKEIKQRIKHLEEYVLKLNQDLAGRPATYTLVAEIARAEGNINALGWVLCMEDE